MPLFRRTAWSDPFVAAQRGIPLGPIDGLLDISKRLREWVRDASGTMWQHDGHSSIATELHSSQTYRVTSWAKCPILCKVR
jgi:hypothetical protein